MKPRVFPPFYCALLCGSVSILSAADATVRSWDSYMPANFKAPEPVVLARNPFQGLGRSLPSSGTAVSARNTLSSRLSEQLRRGVHGLVISGEHPCILFGSRIITIGQKVELPVEDQGGKRTMILRLRSVSREQLGFLTDEAGARLLGSEEWTCILQREALP